MRFFGIGLLILLGIRGLCAQPVPLENSSFEDTPGHSRLPRGWVNLGLYPDNPPDIQPTVEFRKQLPAFHGKTYLGMVIRVDRSVEVIGQKLAEPLEKGHFYVVAFAAHHSKTIVAQSQAQKNSGYGLSLTHYSHTARLQILGARENPEEEWLLLAESPTIDHADWKHYEMAFQAPDDLGFFIIRPVHAGKIGDGNVMLDRLTLFEVPEKAARSRPLFFEPADTAYTLPKVIVEMKQQVQSWGSQIGFEPDASLKSSSPDSLPQPVVKIAALLRQHPRARLTIAVDDDQPDRLQRKIAALQQAFGLAGASDGQLQVLPWKPDLDAQPWFWPIFLPQKMTMRLEYP